MLNVPPSPSLSACRMTTTYLTVTMSVRDQMTMERTPTRSLYEGSEVKVEEKT